MIPLFIYDKERIVTVRNGVRYYLHIACFFSSERNMLPSGLRENLL